MRKPKLKQLEMFTSEILIGSIVQIKSNGATGVVRNIKGRKITVYANATEFITYHDELKLILQ